MRIPTVRGRFDRDFKPGKWPWHIRPAQVGGSNYKFASAECNITAVDTTPIPAPAPPPNPYTEVYGSKVPIVGTMPDITKTLFTYCVVPMAETHSQGTYSSISYTQSSSVQYGIVLYKDNNKITYDISGLNYFLFGETSMYSNCYSYGGLYFYQGQNSYNNRLVLNMTGPNAPYPVPQSWQTTPPYSIVPTHIGLYCKATRVAASFTARILMWWTK